MLMGTRDKALNDTVATTWLRTVDYDVNAEAGQWNYLEIETIKWKDALAGTGNYLCCRYRFRCFRQ